MKSYKTLNEIVIIIYVIFLTNCTNDYDSSERIDTTIYFKIKGDLIDPSTGHKIKGMIVTLEDIDRYKIISSDSSMNGSYFVYETYFTDPHMAHKSDSHIAATSPNYFGDTIVKQYSYDTLRLDILVKPVGKIILNFHNLINVQKVLLSTLDNNISVLGHIRNYSVLEFKPSAADTTLILPAYPDRENWFGCWFNEYLVDP